MLAWGLTIISHCVARERPCGSGRERDAVCVCVCERERERLGKREVVRPYNITAVASLVTVV